jgi:hypothetical protein
MNSILNIFFDKLQKPLKLNSYGRNNNPSPEMQGSMSVGFRPELRLRIHARLFVKGENPDFLASSGSQESSSMLEADGWPVWPLATRDRNLEIDMALVLPT